MVLFVINHCVKGSSSIQVHTMLTVTINSCSSYW